MGNCMCVEEGGGCVVEGESGVGCVGACEKCVGDVVVVLGDRSLLVVCVALCAEGFMESWLWVFCVCVCGVTEEVGRQGADV